MCHLPPTAEWSWIMETNLQQNHDNKTLNTNTEHTKCELPLRLLHAHWQPFQWSFRKWASWSWRDFHTCSLESRSDRSPWYRLHSAESLLRWASVSVPSTCLKYISYYSDIQYLSLKCFHPLIFRVVQHAFASKLRIDGVILNSEAQQQDVPCERHGSRPWCDYPSLDPTRVGCTIPYTVHWHIIMSQYVSYCIILYHITACHVVASHLRLDRWCTVGLLPQSGRTTNYPKCSKCNCWRKNLSRFPENT